MDKYLLPEDDGLLARESGEWVKEKLFYVQRYIDIFETAMRQKSWRRRVCIDLLLKTKSISLELIAFGKQGQRSNSCCWSR